MRKGSRKALIVASAILAGVGVVRGVSAAPVTQTTSPATIDGWTISWPTPGVGLSVSQDASNSAQVDLEKSATFSSPNQGFQITFAPTGTPSADVFVIPDESIINETGSAFKGFSFILINSGSVNATFAGPLTPGFIPPTGPGYDYTSVTENGAKTELDYVGTQANGATSFWGAGIPNTSDPSFDGLVIDAPTGSVFSLKELSVGGGGPPAVPVPAAAWQSLIGLVGVGLFATLRGLKRKLA
jgi:hypothetical protein